MLSRLRDMLAGTANPSYPSAVLILEAASTTTYVLHVVPENSAIERVQYMRPGATHFRYGGSIERSREQLGTVLLHVGDGDTPDKFFTAVSVQATRLLREKAATQESGTITVDEALRYAALSNLHEREGREPPVNAAQSYPVFLVRIYRSQPGKIMTDLEPTSISHW